MVLLFCAGDIGNEIDLILRQMVNLYVTVRGFAFAETCLEMYKEAKGATVSKKKGLRKELSSTSVEQLDTHSYS